MVKKQYRIDVDQRPIYSPTGDLEPEVQVEVRIIDIEEEACVKRISVAPNVDVKAASEEAYAQAQAWVDKQGGEIVDE